MFACLRFRLSREWYALPVEHVIEVVSLVAITPLPESAPHVLGAITVRGQTVTGIDLRPLLGHTQNPLKLTTPLIILRSESNLPLAVLVDEVDNVVDLPNELEVPANTSRLLAGITRYNEAVHLVLNVDMLASVL